MALVLPIILPFSSHNASAATLQTGTIDKVSGVVNVYNAPSTKGKIIGTLKRSDKVKVISQNKTWTTLQYGKGKGYISSNYIRFYKSTSLYSVKQVTDKIIATERNMWTKTFTKKQFYNMMLPVFTKTCADQYFKSELWQVGKDRS